MEGVCLGVKSLKEIGGHVGQT